MANLIQAPITLQQLLTLRQKVIDRTISAADVTPELLNYIIPDGAYANESLAFWLASDPRGQALLRADNNRLGLLISAQALNALIAQGPNAGCSVAFWLAGSSEGRALLSADNNRLGLLINAQTLNTVIVQGSGAGCSVAFWLAGSPEGRALLSAGNNRLGLLINAQTLNTVIAQGPYAGRSVAFWLAGSPEGRALLSAGNSRLGLLINEQTLNAVMAAGQNVGYSVVHWLAGSPVGMAILRADNNRLAALINEQILNTVIAQGPYAGRSVASWLAAVPEGQALLSADNFRLARMAADKLILIDLGYYDYMFEILDGKADCDSMLLAPNSTISVVNATPIQLDMFIENTRCPALAYSTLIGLAWKYQTRDLVCKYYLEMAKKLLLLNFDTDSVPDQSLVKAVAHRMPSQLVQMLLESAETNALLNLTSHLVKNINANNVDDIYALLNTLNADADKDEVKTKIAGLYALFYHNPHAKSFADKLTEFAEGSSSLHLGHGAAGCVAQMLEGVENFVEEQDSTCSPPKRARVACR